MKSETLDALEFALLCEAEADKGLGRWLVQIIKAGTSKNGNHYTPEVLQSAAPLFEGRPLNVYELGQTGLGHLPPRVQAAVEGGLIQATVGVLTGVRWDDTRQALVGEATITSPWFADTLHRIAAAVRGPVTTFGLSIAAVVDKVRESARTLIKGFRWVDSVDVVTSPAAGGEFLRALEALAGDKDTMDEQKIRELIAEALKGLAPLTEQRVTQLVAEAVKAATTQEQAEKVAVAEALKAAKEAADKATAEIERFKAEAAATAHRNRVTAVVEAVMADHPEALRRTAVKVVLADLAADATDEKVREAVKAFADTLPAPIKVTGRGRIRVVRDQGDKLQAALDGALGVATPEELDGVAPLRGLQEAYIAFTGDTDLRPNFAALGDRVGEATQLSTTFTVAMGTSMHKRLCRAYRAPQWREEMLVSSWDEYKNFKTNHIVRVGGFADLPVVAEGDPYTEVSLPSEEAPTIALAKRGKIFPLTWEKVLADDLGVIRKELDKLGRAARRTFAHAIFACLHDNPTLWDSKALFHADHNNLGATALGYATLIAARAAIMAQTELTSAEPLLLDPKEGGLLVIPTALEQGTFEILKARGTPGGSDNDGNFVSGWFGENLERVLVDPFTGDANNWQVLANPADAECIVVGTLNGQREPELIAATDPAAYGPFTADQLEYKIRHVWQVAVVDYRPAYGAVVV